VPEIELRVPREDQLQHLILRRRNERHVVDEREERDGDDGTAFARGRIGQGRIGIEHRLNFRGISIPDGFEELGVGVGRSLRGDGCGRGE